MNDLFWINNPKILIENLNIIPSPSMTEMERLNTISRLIIVMTIILYISGYNLWFYFMILSLSIIIFIYYYNENEKINNNIIETYRCYRNNNEGKIKKEDEEKLKNNDEGKIKNDDGRKMKDKTKKIKFCPRNI